MVVPGEAIGVRTWDEGDRILVSATVASDDAERDGAPVLADAVLTKA